MKFKGAEPEHFLERTEDDKGIRSGHRDGSGSWIVLNENYSKAEGVVGVCTVAMPIENVGCIVQTIGILGGNCSVSQVFVPGVKIRVVVDDEDESGNLKNSYRILVPLDYEETIES